MKRILLIHDAKSSEVHQITDYLKRQLPDVGVMAPDLPNHPGKTMRFLNKLCYDSQPDVIIGVAMGANYAQHLHGYRKILINPKPKTKLEEDDNDGVTNFDKAHTYVYEEWKSNSIFTRVQALLNEETGKDELDARKTNALLAEISSGGRGGRAALLQLEDALMNILEEVSTHYYHSYYDVRDTTTEGFQKTTRDFVYDIEEIPYMNYIKFLYEGLHTFFVEDVKEKQFMIFAECGRKMDPKDALTLLAYQYYDFVDWRYDRTIAYDAAKQWLARYNKEYPEEIRWNEKSSFIEIIPYLVEDCDKSKLPKFHIGELDTEEEIDMILDLLECYDMETVQAICWGLNEKFWAEKRRICFILIKVIVMDDGTIDTSERGIFLDFGIAEAAMQDWTLSNRERLLCYIIRTVPRYEPFCNEMVKAIPRGETLLDDLRFKEFVYMPSGFQRKQHFNVGDNVQYIFYNGKNANLRKSSIEELTNHENGILMSDGYMVPERYVFPI